MDIEELCVALQSNEDLTRKSAEQALRHLVGSLLAGPTSGRPLVGADSGPWCDLLERVSRNLRRSVAYTIRSLLTVLCDQAEAFSFDQQASAGKTARRLLEFAWEQKPRDRWLVIHALETACKTFDSDLSASAALLQRSIEPEHLSLHGFEELPWLARQVKQLVRYDAALVEKIYRAAFAHREPSDEPTPMGESRILSLTSNRRQDYDMALYELAEVFPEFLKQAPKRAVNALTFCDGRLCESVPDS